MSVKRTDSGIVLTENPAIIKTSPVTPPTGLKENLVSYYPFDTDANDVHGSNNGSVTGAVLTTGDGGKIDESQIPAGVINYLNELPYLGGYQLHLQ